jgi:hypothetical protein
MRAPSSASLLLRSLALGLAFSAPFARGAEEPAEETSPWQTDLAAAQAAAKEAGKPVFLVFR